MNAPAKPGTAVAVLAPPRLPYHPVFEERFGVDKPSWKALVEAVFPNAESPDSVMMALSYCKARNLDIFKRPVHIVPVWDSKRNRMVETVWPGIAELRTTAMRTGLYAGKDKTLFGPDITRTLGGVEMTFPEWAQVTVYRVVPGAGRCAFEGPQVYWLEYYATAKRDTDAPNAMWKRKTRSQIEKCAEAAALRVAFPEELGNEYAAEEVEGQAFSNMAGSAVAQPTGMRARLEGREKTGGFDPAHVERELSTAIEGEFTDATFSDEEVDAGAQAAQEAEADVFPGDRATAAAEPEKAAQDRPSAIVEGMRTGRDLLNEQEAASALEDLPERALKAWTSLMDAMDAVDSMDALDELWKAAGDLKATLAVHAKNRLGVLQAHYNGRLEALS